MIDQHIAGPKEGMIGLNGLMESCLINTRFSVEVEIFRSHELYCSLPSVRGWHMGQLLQILANESIGRMAADAPA